MGKEEERKPEVLVRSMMSLHEGVKTRVRVDSELSQKFDGKVETQQGSVPTTFLSAVVIDVVTELARERVLSELLYADYLELMSK